MRIGWSSKIQGGTPGCETLTQIADTYLGYGSVPGLNLWESRRDTRNVSRMFYVASEDKKLVPPSLGKQVIMKTPDYWNNSTIIAEAE